MYILKFSLVFSIADEGQKKLFPDVVKDMLLENIHILGLNLLSLVYIVWMLKQDLEIPK